MKFKILYVFFVSACIVVAVFAAVYVWIKVQSIEKMNADSKSEAVLGY